MALADFQLSPEDLVISGATLGFPLPSEQIPLAAKHGFSAICVRTAEWLVETQRGTTNHQLRQMIADAGLVVADIDCLAPILGSGEPAPEFFGATDDDIFACAEALGLARSILCCRKTARNQPQNQGRDHGSGCP